MTSLYMVLGGVAVFIILVLILMGVSKASGKAIAKKDSYRDAQYKRDAFDSIMSRPNARGRQLIDKLRRNLGR